jgi:hypothetical protein
MHSSGEDGSIKAILKLLITFPFFSTTAINIMIRVLCISICSHPANSEKLSGEPAAHAAQLTTGIFGRPLRPKSVSLLGLPHPRLCADQTTFIGYCNGNLRAEAIYFQGWESYVGMRYQKRPVLVPAAVFVPRQYTGTKKSESPEILALRYWNTNIAINMYLFFTFE